MAVLSEFGHHEEVECLQKKVRVCAVYRKFLTPALFHDYSLAEIIDYFYSNPFKHYVARSRKTRLKTREAIIRGFGRLNEDPYGRETRILNEIFEGSQQSCEKLL